MQLNCNLYFWLYLVIFVTKSLWGRYICVLGHLFITNNAMLDEIEDAEKDISADHDKAADAHERAANDHEDKASEHRQEADSASSND